ncbi:hypothetical protein FHV99_004569 [Ochrobactrum sp. P20RRXII]|nr:hypothetical protein [Ochrobactrum sp. P20RRXII]NIH77317.1 hypothetical protein [Ochrobactrum sp. P20RRXII]
MKCISIWQPFATLAAKGYKVFETRSWMPPKSLIGQRIGIASTKIMRPEQRAYIERDDFKFFYQRTGLPSLQDLPHGYLLGTAILDRVEFISEEFLEEISAEEYQYGWYELGHYAWALIDPIELARPVPIRGKQGIYDWNGPLEAEIEPSETFTQERPQDIRRLLRVV